MLTRGEVLEESRSLYEEPATAELSKQASIQEAAGYAYRDEGPRVKRPCKTRVEEIWELAERMSWRRLGLAFCIGLRDEARAVSRLFSSRGLEVFSVMCKAGAVPKERLGLEDADKIYPGRHESMCNPIAQAKLLEQAGTELNVVLGLCVGHDSLFFQHSAAPCTVLATKDRVTGHNPLAAIYTLGSYYSRLRSDE
jgi:uncharacterized metal-binding protein